MAVAFDQGVTPVANVLIRQVDTELVLLHLDSELYFGLDEIGTAMWEALIAQPTIEDAYIALLGTYDADPDELRADVAALVGELLGRGLIAVNGQ